MEEPLSAPVPGPLRPGPTPTSPSEIRDWGDPYTPSNNSFSLAPIALTVPSSQYSDNTSAFTPILANAAQNGAQHSFLFRNQSLTPQEAQQPQATPPSGTQKRGANSPLLPNRTNRKSVRFDPPPAVPFSFQSTNSDSSEKLVLQARDLLVKAYSAT